MEQTVRDHARRRARPRQQDRRVAHQPAGVRRSAAAVQPRLPGGREHPGLALSTPSRGDYEAAWRALTRGQPVARRSWARVCYHPCETSCNRGQARRAGGHQLGRALPRRRGARSAAGRSRRRRRERASACWSSARARRGCPPRTTCAGWATTVKIVEAGPFAGGMMRFGIPKYRLPRDVLDAEVQRILDLGVELELELQGRRTSSRR